MDADRRERLDERKRVRCADRNRSNSEYDERRKGNADRKEVIRNIRKVL